jgi:hypothetical protein
MKWPNKEARERFEIDGFIEAYERLPEARRLVIVTKGEKPDWLVRDESSGEKFGVELTSVYLDDRSVPDNHMIWSEGAQTREIPYCEVTLEQYKARLIEAIQQKIIKARSGYDVSHPLILAIYVNEYVGIYLDQDELNQLVKENEQLFDSMAPFNEIAFWSLGNGGIFRVRPT